MQSPSGSVSEADKVGGLGIPQYTLVYTLAG